MLLVAAVLVVIAVTYTDGRLPLPGLHPTATTSPKPGSTSTTAGPEPSPTMPTKPADVLKKNPIYALKVPASCPAQTAPGSSAAFRKQVKALVSCQNKAWKKALAGTAIKFSAPKIEHYSGSTRSPCGTLGTNFPASYCTADHTLYFSKAAFAQGQYYRLAVAEFVIHEYAHHVQSLADIFENTDALDESRASISRRIELQAHCMAQYGLTHSDLGFTAADRADLEYQFGYTSDATGHGSPKAERYWGRRGLAAAKIGSCNTWKAKPAQVK
ncbi:MAG: neutral zinc metallopeptidase [Propionicimonas sp.]